MTRMQRKILIEFAVVLGLTLLAAVAMINLKDWVNRSEAMRAMQELARQINRYRQQYARIPPESWVKQQAQTVPGYPRLGRLEYRGLWIDFESPPDTILAYSERNYRGFAGRGYVVMRLNGRVEWLDKQTFEKLLARQQTEEEVKLLEKHPAGELEPPRPIWGR